MQVNEYLVILKVLPTNDSFKNYMFQKNLTLNDLRRFYIPLDQITEPNLTLSAPWFKSCAKLY